MHAPVTSVTLHVLEHYRMVYNTIIVVICLHVFAIFYHEYVFVFIC